MSSTTISRTWDAMDAAAATLARIEAAADTTPRIARMHRRRCARARRDCVAALDAADWTTPANFRRLAAR